MTNKVRLSALAHGDLVDIIRHIASDNPARAAAFAGEIIAKAELYAARPMIGRARPELAPKVLSFPHGNYVVFYRPYRRGIQLVRVLHSRRDIGPEMLSDDR